MPPGGISVLCERAGRLLAQVVAVHRDVELADGDRDALDAGDALADAAGQRHAAGVEAEQDEVGGALVALEDLVGDAGQRPGDVTGVEHDARVGHAARTSFSASRDGSLKDVAAGVDPQGSTAPTLPAGVGSTVESNRPLPVQRQELNMSVGYSAAYWWGITPWKKAGRESRASFDVMLDARGARARTAPGPGPRPRVRHR